MSTDHLIPQPHHSSKGCCTGQSATRHYTKKRAPIQNTEEGLQWGSDPSFCYHGFSNPAGTWSEHRLVRTLLRDMACMTSGVDIDGNPDVKTLQHPVSYLYETQSPMLFKTEPSSPPKPTNVRPFESGSIIEKREDSEPPSKKRKCVQKPGQALCHCRSEKKRREAVGKGYQDLCHIVPGLENNNFTRKYVLDEAAKFLESLLSGNEKLRQQLAALNEENGV